MSTEYYLYSQLYSNKVLTYDEVTKVVRLSDPTEDASQMWVLEVDKNVTGEKTNRIRNVGSSYYLKRNNKNVTVGPIKEHVDDYTLWLISECPGSQDKICTDEYDDETQRESKDIPEGDKATAKFTSECRSLSQTDVTFTCADNDKKTTGEDEKTDKKDATDKKDKPDEDKATSELPYDCPFSHNTSSTINNNAVKEKTGEAVKIKQTDVPNNKGWKWTFTFVAVKTVKMTVENKKSS